MALGVGELQPELADAGRLRRVSTGAKLALADIAVLAIIGVLAAAVEAYVHLNLKVPGHAILRAILPMTVGMALVPHCGAGTVMGFFAALGAVGFNQLPGEGISLAAGVAMILVGPAIDLAMWSARPLQSVYPRFAMAGALANLAAFGFKLVTVSLGLLPQKEPLVSYMVRAFPSYLVCGALAGLLAGAICFRWRPTDRGDSAR